MSENDLRRDVAAWVRNAEQDRGIALSIDRTLYANGVCFHCQQCVEKYLKAMLVAHDHVPKRIHDLVVLGTEGADYASEIAELYDDLRALTGFAVIVRYPEWEAGVEEAEEAIEAMRGARAVLRQALGLEAPAEDSTAEEDEERDRDTTNGDECADT